jgi:hypothetical protein
MGQDDKKPKWSLFQKFVVLAICTPAVLFFVAQARNTSISENTKSVAGLVARKSNEQCPRMVDANTRLESASSQGTTLINNYTVLNIDSNTFDLKANLEPVRARLIENYKSNPALSELRKRDIQIVHIYSDSHGLPLMTISVSPRDF